MFKLQNPYFFLLSFFLLVFARLQAQSPAELINDLQNIHKRLKDSPCDSAQLLSNRAMTLFLSDRVGSYLTNNTDLSFYKNYVTLNTRDGIFSLNHNMHQPKGFDEPVRSFMVLGIKANIANAFAATFSNTTFTNELGFTFKNTWFGKNRTSVKNCSEKYLMDVKRGVMLESLIADIQKQEAEFGRSMNLLKQDSLSNQNFTQAREAATTDFNSRLREESSLKFATAQYQDLANDKSQFKTIRTHWTDFFVYLPLIPKRFVVAENYQAPIMNRGAYSFEVLLQHTKYWESKQYGRFIISLQAQLLLNNLIETNALERLDYKQYTDGGGVDSILLNQREINTIFLGSYRTFLSPSTQVRIVYFPPTSHIGFSTSLEKNFGTYKALNWCIGIPVVLIDKKDAPAANFEFKINYYDITHEVFPNKHYKDNISISLAVGVPFSKIVQ